MDFSVAVVPAILTKRVDRPHADPIYQQENLLMAASSAHLHLVAPIC